LPEWFIKLFTQVGDTVLDPFAGSGTTLRVARRLKRKAIGIEIVPEYVTAMREQLDEGQLVLMEPIAKYKMTKVAKTRGKAAGRGKTKLARSKSHLYAAD
jgi:site-specific DNA-methyltransferase (adenine-specific)/site-specific DNA-methyltransferase (cytosine-N4-specific)